LKFKEQETRNRSRKSSSSPCTANNSKNQNGLLTELCEAQKLIFETRETEPLMRNAVRCLIGQVQQSSNQKVSELSDLLIVGADGFFVNLMVHANAQQKLVPNGFKTG
jgi:hypothetical protein